MNEQEIEQLYKLKAADLLNQVDPSIIEELPLDLQMKYMKASIQAFNKKSANNWKEETKREMKRLEEERIQEQEAEKNNEKN